MRLQIAVNWLLLRVRTVIVTLLCVIKGCRPFLVCGGGVPGSDKTV